MTEEECENGGGSGFVLLNCEECGDPVCFSHCVDAHMEEEHDSLDDEADDE